MQQTASPKNLLRDIEKTARAHLDFAEMGLWLASVCKEVAPNDHNPGGCNAARRELDADFACNDVRCSVNIGRHTLSVELSSIKSATDNGRQLTTGVIVTALSDDVPVLVMQRSVSRTEEVSPSSGVDGSWLVTFMPRSSAYALNANRLVSAVPTIDEIPVTHFQARVSLLKTLTEQAPPREFTLADQGEALVLLLAIVKVMSMQRNAHSLP